MTCEKHSVRMLCCARLRLHRMAACAVVMTLGGRTVVTLGERAVKAQCMPNADMDNAALEGGRQRRAAARESTLSRCCDCVCVVWTTCSTRSVHYKCRMRHAI